MNKTASEKQYHITATGIDRSNNSPCLIIAPEFAPDIGIAWERFLNGKSGITFHNVYITEVKRNE